MAPQRRPQMSFHEEPLNDPDLEKLLDKREEAKEDLEPYRLNYKGLNDQFKAKIGQRELPDGTYRAGDFIIKISTSESREVSFERKSGRRITISPAKV